MFAWLPFVARSRPPYRWLPLLLLVAIVSGSDPVRIDPAQPVAVPSYPCCGAADRVDVWATMPQGHLGQWWYESPAAEAGSR